MSDQWVARATADVADAFQQYRQQHPPVDLARFVEVDLDTTPVAHVEQLLVLLRQRDTAREARIAHANELLSMPTIGAIRRGHEVDL